MQEECYDFLHMSKKFKRSLDLVEARTRGGKQPRMQNFDGLDVSDKLHKFEKVLDDDGADSAYKELLMSLASEAMGVEGSRNPRETDKERDYNFYNEEEKEEYDPEFKFVLDKLEPYENSYLLTYDDNAIKFEEATSSDAEHDEELRSATKQNGGPLTMVPLLENKGMRESHCALSSKMKSLPFGETSKREREENGICPAKKKVPRSTSIHPTLASNGDSSLDNDFDQERGRTASGAKQKNGSESARMKKNEKLTRRILQNKPKSKEEDEIVQMEPDYCFFLKYIKLIDGHHVYDHPGHKRIVCESRSGERNQVKEEPDDGSYSDVEIIDSTEFYKMIKTSKSNLRDTTDYRQKVISNLKKPFNEEEYTTLLRDIKLHLTKDRHLELRRGRERPYGTQEKGKSYLDYHPVLKRKLLEAEGDPPKCLNLLRGFFLWIKQPECFCPWLDEECLATYPSPIIDFL